MIAVPYPVVLASRSPRRAAMLRPLVGSFTAVAADVEEEAHTCDDPWRTATRLARLKADRVFATHSGSLVIGGDTVVAIRNGRSWTQLAKPVDGGDAVRMLAALSDREHVVVSGLALAWPEGVWVGSDTTVVRFRAILEAEARAYSATGEPLDKAGGYAIQGGASSFVAWTLGSLTNVIGLPLEALVGALALVE